MGIDVYTWVAWAVAALALVLGAQVFGVTGLLTLIVLAIMALLSISWTASGRARRRMRRHDPRFRPTEEVFHDPVTGEPTRVYVNPETGERRYWTER